MSQFEIFVAIDGDCLLAVNAPFCPDYFFHFNFYGTLGSFMSRFEFESRTYFVVLFILLLSCFVPNYYFVLIFV